MQVCIIPPAACANRCAFQEMCVSGRRKLYTYLAAHSIAHKRAGKMTVAADPDQIGTLEDLLLQGHNNDVEGLSMLDKNEATRLEPQLKCVAALMSAETGLLDSRGYLTALWNELEELDGAVLLGALFSALLSCLMDSSRSGLAEPIPMRLPHAAW